MLARPKWWVRSAVSLGFVIAINAIASAAVTEITMYSWYSKTGRLGAALAELVDIFMQENPDVKVTLYDYPNAEMQEKLMVTFLGGVAPDISMVSGNWAFELIEAGVLRPLDDLLARSNFNRADISRNVWDAVTAHGKTYLLPMAGGPQQDVWYNKDMFDQVGLDRNKFARTWEEWQVYLRKLTLDKDGDGNTDQYGITHVGLFTLLFGNGADWLAPDGRSVAWNSPAGVQAGEFLRELYQVNRIASQGNRSHFVSQRAAMHMEGPYSLSSLRTEVSGFEFGYSIPPQNISTPRVYGAIDAIGIVNSTPEKEEAAWRLAMFLLRPDIHAKWSVTTGFPPFTLSSTRQRLFQEEARKQPEFATFYNSVMHMVVQPIHPNSNEIRSMFFTAQTKIRNGSAAPRQALDDTAAQANAILSEWYTKNRK